MDELPFNHCWACMAPLSEKQVFCEWCFRAVPKRERLIVDRALKRFQASQRADPAEKQTSSRLYLWALRQAALAVRRDMLGFHIPVDSFGDPTWAAGQ